MRFLPPTIPKKTIFWLDGHIPLFECKSFVTPDVLEQLDGDAGT